MVMLKVARIARIIVDLCEKYDLSEEDLPTSLRAILDSLTRFVSALITAHHFDQTNDRDQRVG